jgi:hypothetical protein
MPVMTDWHTFLRYAAKVAQGALDKCPTPARRQGYFLTFAGPAYALWRDPTMIPEDYDLDKGVGFGDKALIAAGRLLEHAIEQRRHDTLRWLWRALTNPRKIRSATKIANKGTVALLDGVKVKLGGAALQAIHDFMVEDCSIIRLRWAGSELIIPVCEDKMGRDYEEDGPYKRAGSSFVVHTKVPL